MANNAAMRMSVGLNSITWPFRWIFWISMLLLMSWALALLIGLYFHFAVWTDMGVGPFAEAFNLLLEDAAAGEWVGPMGINAATLTMQVSNLAYDMVFVWTGLEGAYLRALSGTTADALDASLYRWMITHAQSLEVAMQITRLYGAKLAMLVASLPLFLLAYVVALVDGLVARYIRRQGGGRESAFLYHRSKWFIVMLLGTLALFALLLPLQYAPRWVLPAAAVVIGFAARLQWAFYKKYL